MILRHHAPTCRLIGPARLLLGYLKHLRSNSCESDSHRFCALTMPEAGISVSNNWENNSFRLQTFAFFAFATRAVSKAQLLSGP
jgi:hypothetical protein